MARKKILQTYDNEEEKETSLQHGCLQYTPHNLRECVLLKINTESWLTINFYLFMAYLTVCQM